MPRPRACESTEFGPLRSSAVLISGGSMRGCVGGVLNVSDTRRSWDGVWCTPPCFFKECGSVLECLGYRYTDFRSVQAAEKAGDAGARRLGLSRFPLWDGRTDWKVVEQRITGDDSTFLLICQ